MNLPPTSNGEISPSIGGVGWGVSLGKEGNDGHNHICAICYAHIKHNLYRQYLGIVYIYDKF